MSQVRLTNEQRLQICRHRAALPKMSQSELVKWATKEFNLAKGISQAAISNILKKQAELENMAPTSLEAKRPRLAQHPDLEEALATWVLQCQSRNVAVNGLLIKAKAEAFAARLNITADSAKFSNGWLQHFQERHKLRSFRIHGESGSADIEAIELALPDLQELIMTYDRRDVYNMDETGKFLGTVTCSRIFFDSSQRPFLQHVTRQDYPSERN